MPLPRRRKKRRSLLPRPWIVVAVLLALLAVLPAVRVVHASIDPYSGLADEDELPPPPPPPRSSRNSASRSRIDRRDDLEEDDVSFPAASSSAKARTKGVGAGGKPSRSGMSFDDFDDGEDAPPVLGGSSESLLIHIVPHSHVDHGWLRTTDGYEEQVQQILSSVTQQLDLDAKRKFIWSETWYFRRWYESLSLSRREKVKRLVNEGRFEFVGGGLVMHDESLSSQRVMMEQILEGHQFLEQAFDIPSPKIAWQIDSPGHSDATPGILSRLGYSVVVLNRVHFRLKERFRKGQHLEFVWRGPSMGSAAVLRPSNSKESKISERENADEVHQIFAHLLPMGYAAPEGNDFEKSGARQVTAPRARATRLLQYARELSKAFRTHHVFIPWGDDLRFLEADKQFSNMDKLIAEIAAENPTVRIQYSTASEYFSAMQRTATSSSLRFPLYLGDFIPYADSGDAYWTGIYSSRPAIKRWSRILESKVYWAGALFSLARAKASLTGHVPKVSGIEKETGRVIPDDAKSAPSWGIGLHRSLLFAKRQALMIGAHHHAITGNARDSVIKDYLKRAKVAFDAAQRVAMESLSHIVAKRKIDYKSVGPHVRPPLKPWMPTDSLELKDDGRQWPLIFTNENAHWRREIIAVRLLCTWATGKRVKVIDGATGLGVPSQVHKSLASSNTADEGGWKADTHLFIYVEVPPLGFSTYFVSAATPAERVSSAASPQPMTSVVVQASIFDMLNGRVVPTMSSGEAVEGVKVMSTTPSNTAEAASGNCLTIDNDHLSVEFDCESGLIRAMVDKRTKKRVLLRQEFRTHESTRGGVNLFRPDRLESTRLQIGERGRLTIAVVRGPLVQEVQILGDGVSQTVRVIRAPHGLDSQVALNLEGHAYVSQAVAPTTPDLDTVVRYSTDMKTSGAFYTDNPSGTLRERRTHSDTPLAANFFPCSSSILLRSQFVLGVVLNQPIGCTGAANVAAGGGDLGVIELMLHRNPSSDDGRGLGEGLPDFGVSRLDTFLFIDQTEAAIARRPNLIARMSNFGELGMAQLDYTALLSPFLNREVWASRFLTHGTFLRKNGLPTGVKLVSMSPRDEVSDEVLIRLEYAMESPIKMDWGEVFNSEEFFVGGVRDISKKPPSTIKDEFSFQCSDRPDDFHASALSSSTGDFAGLGQAKAGYILSEHALRENSNDAADEIKTARKLSMGKGSNNGAASPPQTGGVLRSAPIVEDRFLGVSLPFEMRRGDSRLFLVTLLPLPDERVPKRVSTSTSATTADSERTSITLPPSSPQIVSGGSLRIPEKISVSTEPVVSKQEELPPRTRSRSATERNQGFKEEKTSAPSRSSFRKPHDLGGKSFASLRAELIKEEKRSAALEVRSKRLQQNVEELLRELELFQDFDGSLEQKAAVNELASAEEQLLDVSRQLAESKEKVLMLQRELDHLTALIELEDHYPHKGSRRYVDKSGTSEVFSGVFAGAGGMLVLVLLVQWVWKGRRRGHQAFVPVRYIPVNHASNFVLPVKRL